MITGAPNFPHGKVYEGYRNKRGQEEMMDGIRVVRVLTYITANAGFAKRIADYVSFAISAAVAARKVKTDLIVVTSPQFFTAVAGHYIAKRRKVPWVMEVRDLWPESIRAVGAAKGREKWLDRLERLELFLYRSAARVVVVTHAFKRNLVARGIDENKISVVTNGVHTAKFPRMAKDSALVEQLDLAGKFVVGYVGTHGMAHKLDFILDCAEASPANVHFLFVGGGAKKAALAEQAKGMQNVTMLDPVAKQEVHRYLSITDVALVPLKKSDTFKTVIPSKIFENAAMAKPILLGVEGESQAIIEKYKAGLCFEPENRSDFLRQLERLATDAELYQTLQGNCAALATDYDRSVLAKNMLKILTSV